MGEARRCWWWRGTRRRALGRIGSRGAGKGWKLSSTLLWRSGGPNHGPAGLGQQRTGHDAGIAGNMPVRLQAAPVIAVEREDVAGKRHQPAPLQRAQRPPHRLFAVPRTARGEIVIFAARPMIDLAPRDRLLDGLLGWFPTPCGP